MNRCWMHFNQTIEHKENWIKTREIRSNIIAIMMIIITIIVDVQKAGRITKYTKTVWAARHTYEHEENERREAEGRGGG